MSLLASRWLTAVPGIALAMAATPRYPAAAQATPVFLNHVVIVVDSETYRQIGASSLLRERFAGFQQRTTTAGGGMSWTGTYLFGKNTYLELFAPGGVAGAAGAGMLGFGVEESGSIWRIRDRLARATGAVIDSLLRTRSKGADEVPWFYAVAAQGVMRQSHLPSWVMEYHPDYLRRMEGKSSATSDLSRHAFVAEWYRPERLLEDVVAVTVAVDSADKVRLVREGNAFGYQIDDAAADAIVLHGPELELTLVPVTGTRRGVVQLGLTLNRRLDAVETVRFGARSVLRLERDGTAVWTF